MERSSHKLTQRDFRKRVKRVDPQFYRSGNSAQAETRKSHPIGSSMIGFGWVFLLLTIARNRPTIEASLQQGTLPDQYHNWILAGLVAFLAASFALIGLHVLRFVFQSGPRRKNSAGLLMGAALAFGMINTPMHVWQSGYGMLDDNTRALIQIASSSVENLNLSDVSLVSSRGD